MDAINNFNTMALDVEKVYPSLRNAICCRGLSICSNILFQIDSLEFVNEKEMLWKRIKKYRGTVLWDKRARKKLVMLR